MKQSKQRKRKGLKSRYFLSSKFTYGLFPASLLMVGYPLRFAFIQGWHRMVFYLIRERVFLLSLFAGWVFLLEKFSRDDFQDEGIIFSRDVLLFCSFFGGFHNQLYSIVWTITPDCARFNSFCIRAVEHNPQIFLCVLSRFDSMNIKFGPMKLSGSC